MNEDKVRRTPHRVLYCHCAYAQVVPPRVKAEVLEGLSCSGAPFEAVADLCEMSARKDPAIRRLAGASGELRIAACFPRAVRWLFSAAGAPLADKSVRILNMRSQKSSEVLAGLLEAEPSGVGGAEQKERE